MIIQTFLAMLVGLNGAAIILAQSEDLEPTLDDEQVENERDDWWPEKDEEQLVEHSIDDRWVDEEEEEERAVLPNVNITIPKCPVQGASCHSLGGTCLPPGTPTSKCEHLSTDSTLCGSPNCKCCLDCNTQASSCHRVSGYCRKKCGCHPWEYSDPFHPCPTGGCTCCRRCRTSEECKNGASSGRCVGNPKYYIDKSNKFFPNENAKCDEPKCSCVSKCANTKPCTAVKGYCIRNAADCKKGYVKFTKCGCRDRKNCSCCVPKKFKRKARKSFKCSAPPSG